MKRIIKQIAITCLIISYNYNVIAQCNSWLNLSSPGSSVDGAWAIAIDQSDNVYTTGIFYDSISFGSKKLINPDGAISFYINKFNSNGDIQWAIQLPAYSTLFPPVICQKNGMLFVAGEFSGGVVIGNDTIATVGSNYALFLLKLDLDGNLIGFSTENTAAESSTVYALGITVNSSNEIYLTGRANNIFTIDTIVLNSTNGNYAFLAKFNSQLKVIWAIQSKSATTEANCRGWGITLDNKENVIIGGYFKDDIHFGTTLFYANNSIGGRNPYIAKFDTAGNCQWIRGAEGPLGFDPVYSVASDASGNIYYGSTIDSTMIINGDSLDLKNGSFYYCKYSTDGSLVWLYQAGTTFLSPFHALTSIVIDESNNIWMSGWTDGESNFGSFPLSTIGTYIAKLDTDGNFKEVIGGRGLQSSYYSALDKNGNFYLATLAWGDTISFDGHTIIDIRDTTYIDLVLKHCITTTGIEQLPENNNQMSVFPNPSSGFITITFPSTTKQIQIFNSTGQVMQSKLVHNETKMSFKLYGSGVYFVRAISNSQALTKSLILLK